MNAEELILKNITYYDTFERAFSNLLADYLPADYSQSWCMRHRDEIIDNYLNNKYEKKGFPGPGYEDYFKPETIKTFLEFYKQYLKDMGEDEDDFILTFDESHLNECLSNLKSMFELICKLCHQQ